MTTTIYPCQRRAVVAGDRATYHGVRGRRVRVHVASIDSTDPHGARARLVVTSPTRNGYTRGEYFHTKARNPWLIPDCNDDDCEYHHL